MVAATVEMSENLRHKRVTVMGLGSFGGGVGVSRWLAAQGARVTITDLADETKLANSLREVAGSAARLVLGRHDEADFRDADLVVANPAVPDSSQFLTAAREVGVPITTEINLFVERCRATCVGVTGSVGKSTTTAMVDHVLREAGGRKVWMGGNIGASLLDDLPSISQRDIVVLELSSFQLHRTPAVRWSPQIAAVTNIVPNHLDWHGTLDAYLHDKLNIFAFQESAGEVIVGDSAPLIEAVAQRRNTHPHTFWRTGLTPEQTPIAAPVGAAPAAKDRAPLRWDALELAIPGRHNRENAAVALAIAHLLGVDSDVAQRAIGSFAGLPHRLQRVAVRDGVTYYNDSKSTTPEAAITAIRAFGDQTPLLLILGGYDKHIDLAPAAVLAARRARFAACIGQTGPTMARLVREAGGCAEVIDSFESAVAECRRRATAGDVVLLSPACASWGMFTDYRERGDTFARLVRDGSNP